MTTADVPSRSSAYLDVSKLPASALDHRSPIWWGNLLLLCIETSMFALTIATYFYFRRNFDQWPPPKIDQMPVLYHPVPKLFWGTFNLVLLLASLVPMIIADRFCLRMNEMVVRISALIALLMALASIWVRFKEFPGLIFRWDDNAYGSITWTILGLHLMHLMILSAEDGLMTVYIWVHGLDDKHARDIRVTAVYWYWVVAMWVILYVLIYWTPRWI